MMGKIKRQTKIAAIFVPLLLISLIPFVPATVAQEEEPELVRVNMGILPYFDWMPWKIGKDLGYFEEVGIDLEFTRMPDDVTSAEVVVSGDMDIGCGSFIPAVLACGKFPELKYVSIGCGFLGWAIMVRPEDVFPSGPIKTYDQWYAELKDEDEARIKTCEQLNGRTSIVSMAGAGVIMMETALATANLTWDDIDVIDMASAEGALAFLAGGSDFQLGGYPQVISLSREGCKKLITGRTLGSGAVTMSGEYVTANYLEQNIDILLRLREGWYRVIEDTYEKPDEMYPLYAAAINEIAMTSFTAADAKNTAETISYWPRRDDVVEYFFSEDAEWYWRNMHELSSDFWIRKEAMTEEEALISRANFATAEDVYERFTNMIVTAEETIFSARGVIIAASKEGKDVSDAIILLDQAKSKHDEGAYFDALKLAGDAELSAEGANVVAGISSTVAVIGIVIGIIAALIVGIFVGKKRKH